MTAIEYNRRHGKHLTRQIQEALKRVNPDIKVDGVWGHETVHAVIQFQDSVGLKPDGKVGRATLEMLEIEHEQRSLTGEEINTILGQTIAVESAGHANPYAAMNLDAEYEGWFDKPKRNEHGDKLTPKQRAELRFKRSIGGAHWASKFNNHGTHIGLSWGIIQFTQDGGALGSVLNDVWSRYPDAYDSLFSKEVRIMCNATGDRKLCADGWRSPRVRPVDGYDLWKGPWPDVFERAADMPEFREAQRNIAIRQYFWPAVDICRRYDLTTQADLAVVFDMCVQYGVRGCKKKFANDEPNPSAISVVMRLNSKRARTRRLNIIKGSEHVVYDLNERNGDA